jgi:uncharacterized protein YlxW (UPF0749 family)
MFGGVALLVGGIIQGIQTIQASLERARLRVEAEQQAAEAARQAAEAARLAAEREELEERWARLAAVGEQAATRLDNYDADITQREQHVNDFLATLRDESGSPL